MRVLAVCAVLTFVPLAACGQDEGPAKSGQSGTISVSSPAFAPGGAIPEKYDADHGGVSPPLAWSGVPKGTKELVVLVDSVAESAPAEPQAHWIVYSLSADVVSLPEGAAAPTLTLPAPAGARQGKNSAGQLGWSGPSPADGARLYSFWVYALGKPTGLEPGAARDAVLNAVHRAGVLASGRVLGAAPK